MALVKLQWTETVEYVREVEVDGFGGNVAELMEALTELDDRTAGAEQVPDSTDIQLIDHEVVRAGDEPIAVKIAAKQHEDMF